MKSKKQTKKKITGKMTFTEVISKYPGTGKIFLKQGMHCIGCPIAVRETIEEGAKAHGLNIKKLLEELNKEIK